MRLNVKDVISGGLIVLTAALGLALIYGVFERFGVSDLALGSARRMGPGYMPMLVFYLLGALGVGILLIGLGNGPDNLERWTRLEVTTAILGTLVGLVVWQVMERTGTGVTSWAQLGFGCLAGLLVLSIAPGWRPLGLVHAAFAVFGLALEPLGLIVALVLSIVLASLADRTHRPLGVLGMVVFLCVLSWAVFIWQLDIRVPLWPTIF
ncbi:hypothetical protein [Roseomonas sp. BN140053]|uniref:hypothetical protein n=1 Tax=Roseomonas sp. BN140053 TaxID=3391898 RepID=UPI0039ECAA2E